MSVLRGRGDGTFQPHLDHATNFTPRSVAAPLDLNRDGKLDIALAEGNVAVFVGHKATKASNPQRSCPETMPDLLWRATGTEVANSTWPRSASLEMS